VYDEGSGGESSDDNFSQSPILNIKFQKRPTSIRNLRLQNANSPTAGTTALVTWDASTNTDTYHIYWRNRRSGEQTWRLHSQNTINKKLVNADEIVVVAANAYGLSQAAKLRLSSDGGQWVKSSGVVD